MPSDAIPESRTEAPSAARLAWVHQLLWPFKIAPEDRDFLLNILLSTTIPQSELDALVVSSFGSDELHRPHEITSNIINDDASFPKWRTSEQLASWHQYQNSWQRTDRLIALAKSHQTCPWLTTQTLPSQEPWQRTDRLIAQAKGLQEQALELQPPTTPPSSSTTSAYQIPPATKKKRKQGRDVASRFWNNEGVASPIAREQMIPGLSRDLAPLPTQQPRFEALQASKGKEELPQPAEVSLKLSTEPQAGPDEALKPDLTERTLRGNRKASHYFTPPSSTTKSPSKRPPAGTVSCMPFPPLDAPSFGLIQSKIAHEPFWLLVAVTFLIKTRGQTAVPVFWAVKERFPTPADLANPENADKLLGMIRHLGLSSNRLRKLQDYGRIWMDNPPAAGKVHRVRNYDHRDIPSYIEASDEVLEDAPGGGMLTPKKNNRDEDLDAWEIGHMTQGKYALDSWRIFCRDRLLGRAEGWNGEGARPEFQPEWCRVRPADKELRAYLRWMWMREGFEWDPVAGDKSVLRPEMMKAVNEGRVEWDDAGSLVILETPRVQEVGKPAE